jgi:hypothetical protein
MFERADASALYAPGFLSKPLRLDELRAVLALANVIPGAAAVGGVL